MKIKSFIVGLLSANCYILSEENKEALIIDPGFETKREFQVIEKYINDNSLRMKLIINTHGHSDHVSGNEIFLKNHKCNICIHRNDLHFLNNIIDKSKIILIEDGEFLDFGQQNLRVLFTPGHTPGCICLVGKKFLFSGDTLFYRGIGRMDFPGGSRMDMKKSLLKLMSLPDDYIVFPGHGNSTTIGDEKKSNPFLSWL